MVGSTGFEPVTFRVWGGRATAAPTARKLYNYYSISNTIYKGLIGVYMHKCIV